MLGMVLRLKGVDLSDSWEISMLMKSFEQSFPPRELRPPAWDVTLVLRSLTQTPYEPLNLCSDRDLTIKTVFLLALASSKRVSELHGLSYVTKHSRGWTSVTLEFVPEFVAKTQNPSIHDDRFVSFTIPSLSDFCGNDRSEMLLCPVRALRAYLKRTRPFRPTCRRLFVSTGRTKKEVSKNTISFWLREAIIKAYTSLPQRAGSRPTFQARAHETRSVGPTIAFRKNMSVQRVLNAGVWSRQTTFTSFYLRDVTHRSLDTFSIGPVVAAQQII